MSTYTIFHPWVPGVRPDDQVHCWEALAKFPASDVLHVELNPQDPFAYAGHFRFIWGKINRDIIVVEHDVEPSVECIEALAACPEPICSRPPGSKPSLASPSLMVWLGCTKFSLTAQNYSPWAVLPHRRYTELDIDITGTVSRSLGRTWHIHDEPLEHYHHA